MLSTNQLNYIHNADPTNRVMGRTKVNSVWVDQQLKKNGSRSMSPVPDQKRPELKLDPVLLNKLNVDAILNSPRHMNIGTVMASKYEETDLELWENPRPLGIESHLKALLQSEMKVVSQLDEEADTLEDDLPFQSKGRKNSRLELPTLRNFGEDSKTKIVDFSFDKHAFDQPITKADAEKRAGQGSALSKMSPASKPNMTYRSPEVPISEVSYGPVVRKLRPIEASAAKPKLIEHERSHSKMKDGPQVHKKNVKQIGDRASLEPSAVTLEIGESYQAAVMRIRHDKMQLQLRH